MNTIKLILLRYALKYVIKMINEHEDKIIDEIKNETLRNLIDGATDGMQMAIDGHIQREKLSPEQAIKSFPKTFNLEKIDIKDVIDPFNVRSQQQRRLKLTKEQKKKRFGE